MFFITTAETWCIEFCLIFAEILSQPSVLSVLSWFVHYPAWCVTLWETGTWKWPLCLKCLPLANQELITHLHVHFLAWSVYFGIVWHQRKLYEPERMYKCLMRQWYRQKEFLMGNQKKNSKSRKENPPIVSAKPLLPLSFCWVSLSTAVGDAGA